MQPADFTTELRPNIHLTLPWLDIQLQWLTGSESEVSSECHLDNFDVVPTRKRHPAQCQYLPCDRIKFSTVPCNGRPHRVKNWILWWRTGTAHWTCHLPAGTDTSRMFTPWCVKAGRYSHKVGTKHRDLDATLVVHATERKHDNRYHFYWCFTIPTLVAILLTITTCNGYPYLFRSLLHKIRCTTQPVVNSTPGNKSQSPPEVPPEQQPTTNQLQFNWSGRKSEFVTYSVQKAAWSRDFQSTEQKRWEMRVNYFFLLVSFSTAKKQGKSPNAWWEMCSANICECQFYVSWDF